MSVQEQTRFVFCCDHCDKKASVLKDAHQQGISKLRRKGWDIDPITRGEPISAGNWKFHHIRCPDCVKDERKRLCESEDIRDRINGGFYKSDDLQKFQDDAIESVGLKGHPKAGKAWGYAWSEGHSSGFSEVLSYLEGIAEVLKDD